MIPTSIPGWVHLKKSQRFPSNQRIQTSESQKKSSHFWGGGFFRFTTNVNIIWKEWFFGGSHHQSEGMKINTSSSSSHVFRWKRNSWKRKKMLGKFEGVCFTFISPPTPLAPPQLKNSISARLCVNEKSEVTGSVFWGGWQTVPNSSQEVTAFFTPQKKRMNNNEKTTMDEDVSPLQTLAFFQASHLTFSGVKIPTLSPCPSPRKFSRSQVTSRRWKAYLLCLELDLAAWMPQEVRISGL